MTRNRTRVGIIGAGNIGGNLGRLLARAGFDVLLSFTTNPAKLAALAAEIGATAGTPAQAAAHGDLVVLCVPWTLVDTALQAAGGPDALTGKLVVDTTNQFGNVDGRFSVLDLGDVTAAATNAAKAPDAVWAKAFNTLTSGFQASSAGRTSPDRVVMFYALNDETRAPALESLIDTAGFVAVHTGGFARTEVGHQEPRGDLYGEEFHRDDALAAVARLRGTVPAGTGRP